MVYIWPMSPSEQLVAALRAAPSIPEVATRSGIPRRTVQGLLDGHIPSVDRAAEICRALGLDLTIGPPRPAPAAGHEAP